MALISSTSIAEANTLSDDMFVTIPSGTYSIGCEKSETECKEATIEAFEVLKYPVTMRRLLEIKLMKESYVERLGSNISLDTAYSGDSFVGVAEKYVEMLNESSRIYQYRLPSIEEMLVIAYGKEPTFGEYSFQLRSELSMQQGGVIVFTDTREVKKRVENKFGIVGVLDVNKELLGNARENQYSLFSPIKGERYQLYPAPSKTTNLSATNFRVVRIHK